MKIDTEFNLGDSVTFKAGEGIIAIIVLIRVYSESHINYDCSYFQNGENKVVTMCGSEIAKAEEE